MINLRARSERWPLRPLTRTLFTWEAGKDCNGRTLRRAMESTNPRTREERGRTWDCETRSRSRRFWWTPKMPTACLSPPRGIPTGRTRSEACFVRPTADRRFSEFFTRTKTPGPPISRLIPPIRRRSTPFFGPRASRPGKCGAGHRLRSREAGCINRQTAARHGSR